MILKIRSGYFFSFLCIFAFSTDFSWAQTDSLMRDEVESILISEPEIQGISYQVRVEASDSNLDLSLFDLSINPDRPLYWISDTLLSYETALNLKNSLSQATGEQISLSYFLFEEEVDFGALSAYLDNLIRNELFIPETFQYTDGTELEGELIILGAKIPFKPFYKLKVKILEDIKMIILISILILFLFASIFLVLVMLYIKTKKNKTDILTKRFRNECYEPLSSLLFEYSMEQIDAFSRSELEAFFSKKDFSKPLYKNVMIQEIISLNKNMKGDFKVKLKLIYRKLELHLHTMSRLKSSRWDIITTGIIEINEMDLFEALPDITKFATHKNFYIRSNAIATLLNLSNDKSLTFLAEQNYPLSLWQQMTYLRIIKFISLKDPVNIIYLLESKNLSVRIFGIKLVRYLGRVDCIEKLSGMFAQASIAGKKEILKSYDALIAESELDQVHHALFSNDRELCLRAIEVLKNLGNSQSTALLIERLNVLDDFEYKKAIMETLFVLDRDTFFQVIEGEESQDLNRIKKHLEDPILGYV